MAGNTKVGDGVSSSDNYLIASLTDQGVTLVSKLIYFLIVFLCYVQLNFLEGGKSILSKSI